MKQNNNADIVALCTQNFNESLDYYLTLRER